MGAAHKRMVEARKALQDCQDNEPLNVDKSRVLFKTLTVATDEYVAAVGDYIAARSPSPECGIKADAVMSVMSTNHDRRTVERPLLGCESIEEGRPIVGSDLI